MKKGLLIVLIISCLNIQSAFSANYFISPLPTLACDTPMNITDSLISYDTVLLNWESNGGATSFIVEYGETGFVLGAGMADTILDTFLKVGGLNANTAYDFYVRAACLSDTGDFIGPLSRTTSSCDTAINVTGVSPSYDSINLNWESNGTATGYIIEYGSTGFSTGTGMKDTVLDTFASLSNLNPLTNYDIYIAAQCANGIGVYSSVITVQTLCQPPVISVLPYTQNFDSESTPTLPCGWQSINENNDTINWITVDSNSNSTSNSVFLGSNDTLQGEDYLFTTTISLTQGVIYETFISTRGQNADSAQHLQVYLMSAQHKDSVVTLLLDTIYKSSSYINLHACINPTITKNYFIAFKSSADSLSGGIYVDDFRIQEADCKSPVNINEVELTASSISLVKQHYSDTTWEIEYALDSFTQGAGTIVASTSDSILLSGLQPLKIYQYYTRSLCKCDSSGWAGPFVFRTLPDTLSNPTNCILSLPIVDDEDTVGRDQDIIGNRYQRFVLDVNTGLGIQLGTDVYIDKVELIIQHIRNSEVAVNLISPSGQKIVLFDSVGFGDQNFGNPLDSTCSTRLTLVESAPRKINDQTFGVTWQGDFRPEQNFADLYDNTNPRGYWVLEVIDNQLDGVPFGGKLDFAEIIFANCPRPIDIQVSNIAGSIVDVSWANFLPPTSYEIEVDSVGFTPGTGVRSSSFTENTILSGLTKRTDYEVYVRAICGVGDTTDWSGPIAFSTLCDPALIDTFSYVEDFEKCLTPPQLPCGWEAQSYNLDARTWEVASFGPSHSGSNSMLLSFSGFSQGAQNDWLFMPPIQMDTNSKYYLSFKYNSRDNTLSYREKLKVVISTSTDTLDVFDELYVNDTLRSNDFNLYDSVVELEIIPNANGNYYIAFKAYSPEDQWNIRLDDITIDSIQLPPVPDDISVDEELNNKLFSLYPNPTKDNIIIKVTEKLDLTSVNLIDIHGKVLMSEQLNFSSQAEVSLSLDGIPAGMYFIQLSNDAVIHTKRFVKN